MRDNYIRKLNTAYIPTVFEVCKAVLKRRFSASDLGVPYRWIYHWDDKGLLFIPSKEDGAWRKFNFIDFLWIEMIVELRECGVSLDNIGELKQMLGAQLEMDDQVLQEWFKSGSIKSAGEKIYLNALLLLVAECLATGTDLFLLIDGEGNCMIYNETTHDEYDPGIYHFRQRTHVSLSLRHILVKFINKYELVDELTTLSLVSDNEFEIIKLMREGKMSKLIVEHHQISNLILNKDEMQDSGHSEYLFVDSILNRPYAAINYETTDGKEVRFKNENAES